MAALWGYQSKIRVLCARDLQVSIKESFHAELKDAISRYPWLQNHYDLGVDYLRGRNGTEFLFRGLRHNSTNIKSLSKIDLTIVEEAEDVQEVSWLDLEATVFRQPNSELIAIWNPKTEGSAVDKRFIQNPPDGLLIAKVNWSDNPFLPDNLKKLREREQQRLDPATYAWIWEGAYLKNSDAQVFHNKVRVKYFSPDPRWDGPYYGGDFGFSQDPTAAVEVWIYDGSLYIRREAFKTGLEIDHTRDFVESKIPGFCREVSRWDSARPESISYLKRNGMPKAQAVSKWAGSVEDGIAHLRGYHEIVIHPDCTEMQKEANLYSYKVDRLTGDVTSKIVDAHNHGWDAVRYAVQPMVKTAGTPRIRSL